jgi:hypothetical protein
VMKRTVIIVVAVGSILIALFKRLG